MATATTSAAADAVSLTARLDRGATLGSPTALHIRLGIDPRKTNSPATVLELLYPATIGITTSGLGLESCTRPASDFVDILVDDIGLAGCHPNSVIALGGARAEVHLGGPDVTVIPEIGSITVLTGPVRARRISLVAFVDGRHPFGAKLAYAGEVRPARSPFGGALTMTIPELPAVYEARILLTELTLSIGSRDITYYDRANGRRIPYHPEGIALPTHCPRTGFPFRARVTFVDGRRTTANTHIPCPRGVVGPG